MSKQTNWIKQQARCLSDVRSLLVIYALVDLSWTWIRVQRVTAAMMAAEINPIRSPLSMMADSFLLLLAVIGLRLGRSWSYLVAISASVWLIYRGLYKWQLVASAIESPMLSWAVLRHWSVYSGAMWDFPRFFVAAFVVA